MRFMRYDVTDWDNFNFIEDTGVTDEERAFGDEILKLFQSIIDSNEGSIMKEEFVSERNFMAHYTKHCVGDTDVRSTRTTVYYDFTNPNQYKAREDFVSKKFAETGLRLISPVDKQKIEKYMHLLFEGSRTILFTTSFGLSNNKGPIQLAINAYATNVTENFPNENTLDFAIVSERGETVSLFPVSASYVQTAYSRILRRYARD